jgi:hypothetical protein
LTALLPDGDFTVELGELYGTFVTDLKILTGSVTVSSNPPEAGAILTRDVPERGKTPQPIVNK